MRSKFIAEFIGTFALVFAGCGAIAVSERFPESIASSSIPLVFGLVIATMIYATGHISGAHFNPAVTLAFAVARRFPFRDVCVYWFAQFSGSLAASALLWTLLPEGLGWGATVPAPDLTLWQAACWELLLTFFLMFVIIAVATDTRAVGTMAGVAIGATVCFTAILGGPLSGAALNPARSFGPNLFENEMGIYWLYLFPPILGAVIAAKAYEYIRCNESRRKPNNDAGGCC